MEGKRGSECLLKPVSNIDFNPPQPQTFEDLEQLVTEGIDYSLRIPLFQAKEMTLPQQNTASTRPTSFYYLMCQLDRVQYRYWGYYIT